MLHRAKLLAALEAVSDSLFIDVGPELARTKQVWASMITDPDLAQKIEACQAPWPLPTWQGAIDKTIPVAPCNKPYQLLAIDGSQVYPDKHQGTNCFLINIGVVELQYATGKKGITLQSLPYVFADGIQIDNEEIIGSVDIVNGKREEFELQAGLEWATQLQKERQDPLLFLFDGSLIFWHLESKEQALKNYFLKKYFALLEQFRKKHIWIAGYISLPKGKELINVVRTYSGNFNMSKNNNDFTKRLVDTSVARFFLSPGMRSTLFKSRSSVTELYPEAVSPYFFYFDIGTEIVRIEVPKYLADDEKAIAGICSIILDQAQKGSGFPVGLAEAHEQAVVKGADREFFYHLIGKLSIEQKRTILLSQKSRKKRAMAI